MHVAVIIGAVIVALGAMGVLRWLPARVTDDEDQHAGDYDSGPIEPRELVASSSSGDELPSR
jgi:hypothetical protein